MLVNFKSGIRLLHHCVLCLLYHILYCFLFREFFLYPSAENPHWAPSLVSVNRGASGIDGIISTATGCADTSKPTTLVCGDVTTLHDLNALYGLTKDDSSSNNAQTMPSSNSLPLTTVIVNNGGGAIFSFLPISKHGQDVGFEEYVSAYFHRLAHF